MDQQIFWNAINSLDTQSLPNPPVFPNDTNMSRTNLVGEGSAALSMWSLGEPNSSNHPLNPSTSEEVKGRLGWPSSLTINGGQGSATKESRLEAANISLGLRSEDSGLEAKGMLALEDVNLNLNINQADDNHSFTLDDFIKKSDRNAGHEETINESLESARCLRPNNCGSLGSLQVSLSGDSLNLCGSSSSGTGFLAEDFEGRSGSLLDSQRMACKRKSIEAVPAQTSVDGISSCLYPSENSLVPSVSTQHGCNTSLNIYSSSNYPGEQLNPRISKVRLGTPDCHSFNIAPNAEISQRNCRTRIIPPGPPERGAPPPSHWLPGNSLLHSGPWSTHQLPSVFSPFTQALDSRPVVAAGTSESQPLVPPISGLVTNIQPLLVNTVSSSRAGSSLLSPVIAGQRTDSSTRSVTIAEQRTGSSRAPATIAQRSIGLRGKSSSRCTPRNIAPENMVFVPATDIRNSVQDSASWDLANGSIGTGHVVPVSQSVTPSQVHQLAGPTWIPHQNTAGNYPRRLAGAVRRSFPSGSSGSVQPTNLSQYSANSSNSQEIIRQTSGTIRVHQRSYARSAFLIDGHIDGVLGIPLWSGVVAREERSRALSEHIRNARQQFVHRGENLQFQDVLFDRPLFNGRAADLHDRHRDLRLDVDNMSYEELLALEERIGNVSTGLDEETVLKYLKQRKYVSLSEEAPEEVEPCCVCQEKYVEGDDVGRLDCRHDFHAACIKQWLQLKNLCPICKTTGLDSEKRKKEALI